MTHICIEHNQGKDSQINIIIFAHRKEMRYTEDLEIHFCGAISPYWADLQY